MVCADDPETQSHGLVEEERIVEVVPRHELKRRKPPGKPPQSRPRRPAPAPAFSAAASLGAEEEDDEELPELEAPLEAPGLAVVDAAPPPPAAAGVSPDAPKGRGMDLESIIGDRAKAKAQQELTTRAPEPPPPVRSVKSMRRQLAAKKLLPTVPPFVPTPAFPKPPAEAPPPQESASRSHTPGKTRRLPGSQTMGLQGSGASDLAMLPEVDPEFRELFIGSRDKPH
eukprot:Polyplicarium_translucidae@DN1807_c0_g1_i2.p1